MTLQDGSRTLTADFVVQATGQAPNTQLLASLTPSAPDALINPRNGFVRVKRTMQFADPAYPHLFAVGDVADSGAHKAARPAAQQAVAAAKNIVAMIEGREPSEEIVVGPAAIHLTLGLVRFFSFVPRLLVPDKHGVRADSYFFFVPTATDKEYDF